MRPPVRPIVVIGAASLLFGACGSDESASVTSPSAPTSSDATAVTPTSIVRPSTVPEVDSSFDPVRAVLAPADCPAVDALTDGGESNEATARRHEGQWLAISDRLAELPGWAGSALVEDDAPGVLSAFEVWYGESDAGAFEPALQEAVDAVCAEFDVIGVQVGFSYAELEALAEATRVALSLEGAQASQVDADSLQRIAPIVDAVAGIEVMSVGLDSNDNGLVVYARSLPPLQDGTNLTIDEDGLPPVELRVPRVALGDELD